MPIKIKLIIPSKSAKREVLSHLETDGYIYEINRSHKNQIETKPVDIYMKLTNGYIKIKLIPQNQ